MGPLEIVLLALALSADAFSVGAALGLRYRSARQTFRLAFHFGLFQALLPLVGALAGTTLLAHIERWDHWIVFGLLSYLGFRMIRHAGRDTGERIGDRDLTRGWSLIGFSLAVSIDALAAGVALPAAGAPILASVATIGLVTGLSTLVAIRLAGAIAGRLGSRIEVVAGLVLFGLGTKVLLDHLGLLGTP
jgi:putative Mn2+ efflux pump MntP